MTTCLIVDDDAEIRVSVQAYLQRFGIDTASAGDGAEMRKTLAAGAFDVIVLDIMMPGEDGLSLCRWIAATSATPVIMLTAQSDAASRVLGLELGADDYLGKPFDPRELVARIHALTRRRLKVGTPAATAPPVTFEGWTFDRILRHVKSPEGVVVSLSSAEFRLLDAFVNCAGRILSRDQLIELTRAPGVDVNDRTIDLTVFRLRQKLDARLIRTMRGEGYLFDAPVRC